MKVNVHTATVAGVASITAASAPVMPKRPGFHESSTTIAVKHIVIETSTAYLTVKSRIEGEVKRLDDSYRTLLRENKIDELRQKLKEGAEPNGLMIHYVAVHGDWLALEGGRRQGIVYHIGNVSSAAQMTKHNFGAGLYAPLRLAVYANAQSGTTFEYDLPSSLFGQFHNPDIDKVARSLDERLHNLILKVSR
jgi:uncharacterized protein (DUF302 family)